LVWFGFMVFNVTFNNFSVISWRSVLLMEETGGPGENHSPCHKSLTNYHIMLYTSPWAGFELKTSVVIGTDCICSCKSNYHTITATMTPWQSWYCLFIAQRHQHYWHLLYSSICLNYSKVNCTQFKTVFTYSVFVQHV
jgi:hypothetical protein